MILKFEKQLDNKKMLCYIKQGRFDHAEDSRCHYGVRIPPTEEKSL